MEPQAVIEVCFKTAEAGGRQTSVGGGVVDFYAVGFVIDGEAFDCRVFLGERRLEPGKFYELPVRFLNWDLIRTKLAVSKEFELREGSRIVASGKIIRFSSE